VALSVGLAAGDSAVQNALPSEVGDSVEAAVALIGLSPGIMRALLARDRNIGNAIEFSDGSLTFIEAMLGAACGISRTVMASGEEQLRLLNTLLIAHAEHGMNCSTTAVRTLASAGAGAGASLAGGLLCFSGRFHGGAADRVAGMLRQIRESGLTAAEWLDLEIARRGPVRVYGFGHRIYRTEDPRAAILRSALDRFAGEDGYHDDLLGITVNLADAAAMHPYFRERMIWPNVDLYSGACFRALGIPEHLNSSVIAIGRMAGWLAHWREAVAENSPIVRPRDLYDGVMPELLWPG
jgi:citrate synthase